MVVIEGIAGLLALIWLLVGTFGLGMATMGLIDAFLLTQRKGARRD